jgi:hypothetical protein
MGLETLTGGSVYINSLVATNPIGATDAKSQGDDHIRGIKNVLLNTFPNIDGPVTATEDELNIVVGVNNLKGVAAKTTTYSIVVGDENKIIDCDTTAGAFTVTLPAVATAGAGFRVAVLKSDSNANDVTIDGASAETINGAATIALSKQYQIVVLECDGTEWFIVTEFLGTITDNVLLKMDNATGRFQSTGIVIDDDNNMSGHGSQVNEQTGTTYTLTASDNGKIVRCTNASAVTVTLPQTSTETLAAGFQCTVVQAGAGQVTLALEGSDTIRDASSNLNINNQWGAAYVLKETAGSPNNYDVYGDVS